MPNITTSATDVEIDKHFDTGPQALPPAFGHFSPDVLTNDLGTLATCRFNE